MERYLGVRLLLEHPFLDLQKYSKFAKDWENVDYAYPPFFLACSALLDEGKDFEQGIAIIEALLESGADPRESFKVYLPIHDVLRRSSINDINELRRRCKAEALIATEDGEYIEEVYELCDLEIFNRLKDIDESGEKSALLHALLDKYWPEFD